MKRFYYGYQVLMFCFLCQIAAYGFVRYSFSLYVIPLFVEFGWSRASIMGAITVVSLMTGAASPFVGRAVAKRGARTVMAFGASVSGLSFAMLGMTQSLSQLYLFSASLGVGFASMGVVPASMSICDWFSKRRGVALGVLGIGVGTGGFVAPLMVGVFFIPVLGWRNSYLASGVVTVLLTIPFILPLVKPRPIEKEHLSGEMKMPEHYEPFLLNSRTGGGLNLESASKTRAFWLIAIAYATFSVAMSAIFQNQVPHFEGIGFSAAVAATTMSIVGVGSAIGKFCFGWLCDFIKAKYVLALGVSLNLAAIILLMIIRPTSSLVLLWSYCLMFGLACGSWLPTLPIVVSTIFGSVSYGVILGVMHLLFMGSQAIGPLCAGLIYDATQSYLWAFILCSVLSVLSLAAILMVTQPRTEGNLARATAPAKHDAPITPQRTHKSKHRARLLAINF